MPLVIMFYAEFIITFMYGYLSNKDNTGLKH